MVKGQSVRGGWCSAFFGGMRLLLIGAIMLGAVSTGFSAEKVTLREAFEDDFLIGVALGAQALREGSPSAKLAGAQFSAVTAENDMKWQSLHPAPDRYAFGAADAYYKFAEQNKMKVIGHALVWHQQTPRWVFEGNDGKAASRDELLARMREHIFSVVGRYKGRTHGWDVVNEALADGGPDPLRDSPWRRIIGDDFIDHAFRFAREADPKAELYYNDYGLESPGKRRNCVELVKGMLERGVPIDGVGTQSHFHLEHPSFEEVDKTIEAFADLGLKVMVTELDVDVLPSRGNFGNADIDRREKADAVLDPFRAGLPDEVQERLAKRYAGLFEIYVRHRESVGRVTLWGLGDGQSWLNHFPIRGRMNYPLLFDRELRPKPAFQAVVGKGLK